MVEALVKDLVVLVTVEEGLEAQVVAASFPDLVLLMIGLLIPVSKDPSPSDPHQRGFAPLTNLGRDQGWCWGCREVESGLRAVQV